MTTKKPSERIKEIRDKLITQEYINRGHITCSRETFFAHLEGNPMLLLESVVAYLDEVHQSTKVS